MGERVKEADAAVTKVQSEIQVQLEQTNNKLAIQVHFIFHWNRIFIFASYYKQLSADIKMLQD